MSKTVLVTMRCANSDPVPEKLGYTVKSNCDRCGEKVWITVGKDQQAALLAQCEVVCHVCIAPEIASGAGEEVALRAADPRVQKGVIENPLFNKSVFLEWMMEQGLRDG